MTANGADPVALVVSLNVKRRSVNKGQLAIAAAQAWSLMTSPTERTVAAAFGVSKTLVHQAREVLDAPEVADVVKTGGVTLTAAQGRRRGGGQARELVDAYLDAAEREAQAAAVAAA